MTQAQGLSPTPRDSGTGSVSLAEIMLATAMFFLVMAGVLALMYYSMGGFVKRSEKFAAAYLQDPESFDVFDITAADLANADHPSLVNAVSGRVVRLRQKGEAFPESFPKVACITDQNGSVKTFLTSEKREDDGSISLMAEMFGRDTVAPLVEASICQKAMARTAS